MAPLSRSVPQPRDQRRRRGIVEAGERFVEQRQPRVVNQRALERDALPHAAREAADRIVRAIGEARLRRARASPRPTHRLPVQPGEEREVLVRGQFRVEKQIVAEHADAAAQLWTVRIAGRCDPNRMAPVSA